MKNKTRGEKMNKERKKGSEGRKWRSKWNKRENKEK